jgi:hypothetical protein
MRLAKAASYFNNTVCQDAYTGEVLFAGQFALYDDTKRDAEVGERRILSLDPAVQIPARRTVEAMGTRWLLGHRAPDYFRDKALRLGYVAHEATDLVTIRTLSQICLNQSAEPVWAGKFNVKRLAFTEQSSAVPRQMHVFLSTAEPVSIDQMIDMAGAKYLVRSVDDGPSGTRMALCDEMPEPCVDLAQVTFGTYDPLTDSVPTTAQTVRVLRLRWQSLFAYNDQDGGDFGPGDVQFVVAKAALTVRPGSRVTMSGGSVYNLNWVRSYGDVWLCRGVRHA